TRNFARNAVAHHRPPLFAQPQTTDWQVNGRPLSGALLPRLNHRNWVVIAWIAGEYLSLDGVTF
ncbi:hypothetical protein, partial [Sphingomonas aquatilis]|uniref:hypothetical protein n=1 Tax=Sphingomonas aquatilis TaxID=93063 RepID=UPI001ABFACDF